MAAPAPTRPDADGLAVLLPLFRKPVTLYREGDPPPRRVRGVSEACRAFSLAGCCRWQDACRFAHRAGAADAVLDGCPESLLTSAGQASEDCCLAHRAAGVEVCPACGRSLRPQNNHSTTGA
ncbi:hypothetical protein DIPPA_00796 [Diplonema papillatum]|nr:hypothetical protein DIPPA_00796 [Diplonema papillatum]